MSINFTQLSDRARRQPVVLVAEDDDDDKEITKRFLEQREQPVPAFFVENGEELINYLTGEGAYENRITHPLPHLILLDLNMPRMSGREALRIIKSHPRYRRIPIIVLTTSSADSDIELSYDLGANSFITKPSSIRELRDIMDTVSEYWLSISSVPEPN